MTQPSRSKMNDDLMKSIVDAMKVLYNIVHDVELGKCSTVERDLLSCCTKLLDIRNKYRVDKGIHIKDVN